MIGMVQAAVTRDGRTSTVRRHSVSSLPMDACFAAAARGH